MKAESGDGALLVRRLLPVPPGRYIDRSPVLEPGAVAAAEILSEESWKYYLKATQTANENSIIRRRSGEGASQGRTVRAMAILKGERLSGSGYWTVSACDDVDAVGDGSSECRSFFARFWPLYIIQNIKDNFRDKCDFVKPPENRSGVLHVFLFQILSHYSTVFGPVCAPLFLEYGVTLAGSDGCRTGVRCRS